jgi:hypothetical protein
MCEASRVKSVQQLHTERRLIAIGSGAAFLVDWVIGPILPQFGAAH